MTQRQQVPDDVANDANGGERENRAPDPIMNLHATKLRRQGSWLLPHPTFLHKTLTEKPGHIYRS